MPNTLKTSKIKFDHTKYTIINDYEDEYKGCHFLDLTKTGDHVEVLDLNYGYTVGYIDYDEGPGFVLSLHPQNKFIAADTMIVILEYIELLKHLKNLPH